MLETIVVVAAVAAAMLYVGRRLKTRLTLLREGPGTPSPGCQGCASCSEEPSQGKTGEDRGPLEASSADPEGCSGECEGSA